jgi:hypothetical protein
MMGSAFLLAAVFVSAHASAPASLKAWIGANDKRMQTALKHRDLAALTSFIKANVTSDYRYSDGVHKPMGIDGVIATMKRNLATYFDLDEETTVLSVDEHGNIGSAISKETTSGVFIGRDKRPHRFSVTSTSNSKYRKLSGDWKTCGKTLKMVEMTVDGKPVPIPGQHE